MSYYAIANSTATAGNAQAAITSTYKSQVLVANSSGSLGTAFNATGLTYRPHRWNDLLVGNNSTPADNEIEFDVAMVTYVSGSFTTTVSSLSSAYVLNFGVDLGLSPNLLVNSSVETGITANSEKWYLGLNQRASYRWIANPGQELIVPPNSSGTGNGGLDLRARAAVFTGTVTALVNGWEL